MASGLPPGLRRRHARSCPAFASDDMAVCRCRPAYQAQAGPRRRRLTRTWPTRAAALSWKRDVDRAFARGEMLGDTPTIREAATEWLELAERGIVLARGEEPYRPSTLRGYRRALEQRLFPALGDRRLDQLTRGQLNRFIEDLQARGLRAQTVKNAVIPLRAVYRRAMDLEVVSANPTAGVRVPAGSGRRMRFVAPEEIQPRLDALDERDRALWATAIFAGLRRGELQALRWSDVDLAAGTITVAGSYDAASGTTGRVKSRAGQDRKVPIAAVLRDYLVEHRQRAGARAVGLVFARAALAGTCRARARELPFADQAVALRARLAWSRAKLPPVTLHDCRHTFASLMIAAMAGTARFDPKTIQEMLGHASITQTFDRYGHLFPGAQSEAARLLDRLLADATAGRVKEVVGSQRAVIPMVEQVEFGGFERQAHVPRSTRTATDG